MDLFDYAKEAKLRDEALDAFEVHRARLLREAREIARSMALEYGEVHAPQVARELTRRHPELMKKVDRRFMGGVFRKGWRRLRYENKGSHCCPVSVWALDD